METIVRAGLSNAVAATVLALVVACLARPLARRPAVLHCLWFLVLLKLVTPPLYEVPIPWPTSLSTNRVSEPPAGIAGLEWADRTAEDSLIPPASFAWFQVP